VRVKKCLARWIQKLRKDQGMWMSQTHRNLIDFANFVSIFWACYPSRKTPSQAVNRKVKLHWALVVLSMSENAFIAGS